MGIRSQLQQFPASAAHASFRSFGSGQRRGPLMIAHRPSPTVSLAGVPEPNNKPDGPRHISDMRMGKLRIAMSRANPSLAQDEWPLVGPFMLAKPSGQRVGSQSWIMIKLDCEKDLRLSWRQTTERVFHHGRSVVALARRLADCGPWLSLADFAPRQPRSNQYPLRLSRNRLDGQVDATGFDGRAQWKLSKGGGENSRSLKQR